MIAFQRQLLGSFLPNSASYRTRNESPTTGVAQCLIRAGRHCRSYFTRQVAVMVVSSARISEEGISAICCLCIMKNTCI